MISQIPEKKTNKKSENSYTEAKLHFAYTSKIMTDNATGKNWMSKTFSLQNFASDARQLWRISSTSQYEKKRNSPTNMLQFIEQSMEQ